MRRLIALDLDGTTLNPDGQLDPVTIDTLQAVQAAGHLVVIATGRPDSISEPLYDQLGLTGPMVNFNGALIHQPHRKWAKERAATLSIDQALALTRLKAAFPIHLMVAEGKQLLVADRPYHSVPFLPDQRHPKVLLDEAGLQTAPISVTMFVDEPALPALQAEVTRRFPELTAKTWGAWSGEHAALEVTAHATGKANAIAYVAAQYGIDQKHVWAFGDDDNDLDLLAYAGRAVAVANAKPHVLQAANAVTASNAEAGVAAYLQANLL